MMIRIRTAKNGFIVTPDSNERHTTVSDDEVMVFETFASLVEYLQKALNPAMVLKVPEELTDSISNQKPSDFDAKQRFNAGERTKGSDMRD